MSNQHDYTVGWICAIPTEYVAAQAFLDEKHEGPDYTSPNDNNDYTLGRMGRHNIVIAVLPNGEYGLSSAASVARDMLHSFPNVRIGLMVGIGGGAPSLKHDIRLGDVVVGISDKSGIVQYDFGKAIQGQEFQETGFLNQAPTLLRTAVGGLMAQYESDGNQIKEAVSSALVRKPRLQKKYKRPETTADRLYRSHVVHPPFDSEAGCAAVCGDDASTLVDRAERGEDDDDPAIHYGLIASANTLMKDALVRDEMAKKGVVCFEMEAAGLMNHFPCLVIRGICDYSDSHKNKEWQGYAAMTAAAYAKHLLYRITPNKVEAENKISSVVSGHYEVAKQHREIAGEHLDVAKEHLKSQKDIANERLSEKERECHQLFRLTSNSKDTTYEWYKNRVEDRVKDTCRWFLTHEHYQRWLKQDSGPLLVTADPGCGKSVLAKHLVDRGLSQSQHTATICYFFFKDQDQNTSRQALCALLHQLFLQKPFLIKHAISQFHINGQSLVNSTASLWKILQDSIRDPEAGSIIVVLDALDECAESELADLLRNVENQFYSDCSSKLKYLLTCRPYPHITSEIHAKFNSFPNIHIPGEEESEVIGQEINQVISYRVNQLSLSSKVRSFLEEKLKETLHRTYLWVYLIFNRLKHDFKKTLKGAEAAIKTLPKTVHEAYEDILNKSKEDYPVRKALSIILAASRPLTLLEMHIAMNMNNIAHDSTAKDDIPQNFDDIDLEKEEDFKSRLRSWCGLFISINYGKVYFLHQTAREFLLAELSTSTAIPSTLRWHHSITSHQAHAILAELCVLYLNLFNSSPLIQKDGETSNSNDTNAFLRYSAENWGLHFRQACIADNAAILPFAIRICNPDSKSYLTWFNIYWQKTSWRHYSNFTNLIIASYYGHVAVVKALIKTRADIEARDTKYGGTPLSWAAANGHEDIVGLLINNGADIEAMDINNGTPLLWAAKNGHASTLSLLIQKGAEIDAKDITGGTPLLWAARNKREGIIGLLIEKGADIEAKDVRHGGTPLLWAARNGHEDIVKMMIENRANIETKDFNGDAPLLWAARNGHEGIVKLLVEHRADPEAKDTRHGATALLWAAKNGHESIARLLLDKGADIEAKDTRHGATALPWAARNGHQSIVKLLVERGASIEAKDASFGSTGLAWAAWYGHDDVIKMLVGHGADVEAKDFNDATPLLYAARNGCESIVKLLMEFGSGIEVKDSSGQTPLLWAVKNGHDGVVKLLDKSLES